MVKSSVRPHYNVADIYLLNTQAAMVFLHKIGLNNSFDVERLKYRIKSYEKKFLKYKFRYGEEVHCEQLHDLDNENRPQKNKDDKLGSNYVPPNTYL